MTQWVRRNIDHGGLVTSVLVAGDEGLPPLILLHDGAWGGSAEASWGALMARLAERYFVLAPDLYGFGASSKMVQLDVAPYEFRLRQVGALIDSLGLEESPAHLVGNSFGGAMALRAVVTPWFAYRVRSATSISGTGGPYRTRDSLKSLAHFDGTREDMLRIVRLLTGDFPGIDEHVELRLREASSAAHFRAVSAAGLATPFAPEPRQPDNYPENLVLAQVPITLVTDPDDTLVEQGWADRISAHSTRCEVRRTGGLHSPNISDPTGTSELILDILAGHENADVRSSSDARI